MESYLKSTPEEIISDIILLDQFSRNINRIIRNLDLIEYTNKAIQLSNEWIEKKILFNMSYQMDYICFFTNQTQ